MMKTCAHCESDICIGDIIPGLPEFCNSKCRNQWAQKQPCYLCGAVKGDGDSGDWKPRLPPNPIVWCPKCRALYENQYAAYVRSIKEENDRIDAECRELQEQVPDINDGSDFNINVDGIFYECYEGEQVYRKDLARILKGIEELEASEQVALIFERVKKENALQTQRRQPVCFEEWFALRNVAEEGEK